MSYFGKNLKKIRSVKKLSQTALAALFGLTRASVGAYEEGRAEPKLDTLIQVAKYFSISVDDLVSHEMTVNELYHFNIFDERIEGAKSISSRLLKKFEIAKIPIITTGEFVGINPKQNSDFEAKNFISLPNLSKERNIAILIEEEFFGFMPSYCHTNDILIADLNEPVDNPSEMDVNLWIIRYEDVLLLGEIKFLSKDELLFFAPETDSLTIDRTKISQLLPVVSFVGSTAHDNHTENYRIRKLEIQMKELLNRIENKK